MAIVHQEAITVATRGKGMIDITRQVRDVVARSQVHTGMVTVFIQHTSASLCIQENAAPAVQRDIETALTKLFPEGPHYEHDDEGADDMPGHLRALVTRTSETIPVGDSDLLLGTWQALYVLEHRRAQQSRKLIVHVTGE
jgi:secondary thiamine-phosphate synthase enzyme